jgi:hypothetical protein
MFSKGICKFSARFVCWGIFSFAHGARGGAGQGLVHRFDEIDHMGVGFIFAETTCSLTA